MNSTVRGLLASSVAWLAGAGAAVTVGVVALSRIGNGLAASEIQPLSPGPAAWAQPAPGSPAAARLARSTPSTAATGDAAVPTPTPTATRQAERAFSARGGDAIVRCQADRAYLVSWSPDQGYHAEAVRRGPAGVVSVKFESKWGTVKLSARCYAGIPQAGIDYEEPNESDRDG